MNILCLCVFLFFFCPMKCTQKSSCIQPKSGHDWLCQWYSCARRRRTRRWVAVGRQGWLLMASHAPTSSVTSCSNRYMLRSWPAASSKDTVPDERSGLNSGTSLRNPQMWERVHVGFGGTGRKRKGPCTKQCAWRKHGSSNTLPGGSMPPEAPKHCKLQSRRDAPQMAILEAPCAQNAPGRSTNAPTGSIATSEIPLVSHSHFSGLTILGQKLRGSSYRGLFSRRG